MNFVKIVLSFQIDVRAFDLGPISLSSIANFKVFVDHVATVPPDHGWYKYIKDAVIYHTNYKKNLSSLLLKI